MKGLIIILILIAVILFIVAIYNRTISLRNRYKNAFAQIDVQLQRRHDLIPNLVEATKQYLQHEKETLTQVINARRQAVDARQQATKQLTDKQALGQLDQAENVLTGALGKLFAVAENYPDLKANDTILQLMEELASTENRIGFARQAYNDSVMQFNTYRQQFPNNVIVGLLGQFLPAHPLRLRNPEARQGVNIRF